MSDLAASIQFVITAGDEDDARTIESDLEREGASDVDVDPGGAGIVDPITAAVVGTIVVGAVIQVAHFGAFLKNWWDRRNKPGVVIDARGDTIKIIETSALEPGQVVTYMKDGEKVEHLDADAGTGIADYVPEVLENLPSPAASPSSASAANASAAE